MFHIIHQEAGFPQETGFLVNWSRGTSLCGSWVISFGAVLVIICSLWKEMSSPTSALVVGRFSG